MPLISGCSLGPGSATAETLSLTAPDVPAVDKATQQKAVTERKSGQCPALTYLTNVCLVTRDQARALQAPK